MFTGIIQAIGKVVQLEAFNHDARIYVRTDNLGLDSSQLGDSIAVNGVCLTATELTTDGFWADISGESLQKTTLGSLHVGNAVNLEKALTLQTPLGGHLVSGHVDGVGIITKRAVAGRSTQLFMHAPDELLKYIAAKGSICIDGISLTVNTIQQNEFTVNIVPHTLKNTTLFHATSGQQINLEVDVIARYLERLLLKSANTVSTKLTADFLQQHGFR
ncbi:MAG: riboflavin synthase [Thiotrichaceae bacterium]